MDAVGQRLLDRVSCLIATRPDLQDRAVFGRLIGRPTPSWLSEFFGGKRTTNDLRLVVKMARVFGVTVGYLLGEAEPDRSEGAATLLATWDAADERDRRMLLQFAATIRRSIGEESPPGTDGGRGPAGNSATKATVPQRKKYR